MSAVLMRLPLTSLALIRTQPHHFGRLGFAGSGVVLPSIIPVNYLLDEDKIVIRTDAGSKPTPHSAVPRSHSRWTASTKPAKSAGVSSSAATPKK
jgi:hypothetical protein